MLSGVTTPSQSKPGSNGNEGALRIPQSSSITGASPLASYLGHSLGESYSSAEMQCILQSQPTRPKLFSVIFQDTHWGSLTPQQKCSRCILQPQPTGHQPWQMYGLFGWFGVLQHTMRKTSFKTRQTRNI